ncbi:MAG: peptide chain release factor 2 [Patescibacteria group bacterium]
MKDLIEKIKELQEKISKLRRLLDLAKKQTELKALAIEMSQPDFWNNPQKAKSVSEKFNQLDEEVNTWKKIEQETDSLLGLAETSEQESDDSLKKEITRKYQELNKKFNDLEFLILLSGPYDSHNVIMAIHAGAGGVDAQDWAEMLLRMFLRFAEKKKWPVTVLDKSSGAEAGLKSVSLEIKGHYAYGFLRSEAGVHRLVRISPFDAEKMRHTSFALVEVLPELEEVNEVEIKPEDLRIDVFRSSGHGGQSVNTTDSAVRIVHLPTEITVVCRNERSQSQNKENAMKYLKSKLHKFYSEKKQQEKQKIRGDYQSAEWGSQIRSYVLHPYKMVKDHRTNQETSDVNKVLDGQIDDFMEAYLRKQQ